MTVHEEQSAFGGVHVFQSGDFRVKHVLRAHKIDRLPPLLLLSPSRPPLYGICLPHPSAAILRKRLSSFDGATEKIFSGQNRFHSSFFSMFWPPPFNPPPFCSPAIFFRTRLLRVPPIPTCLHPASCLHPCILRLWGDSEPLPPP